MTPEVVIKAATVLSERLTDAELVELAEFMDGDPYDTVLAAINGIVEERHPEIFAAHDPGAVEKEGDKG